MKRDRAEEVQRTLARMYPKAKCALDFSNPFELLVATILAAQSTDVRVNLVTKALFRKYRGPQDFVDVPPLELERDIHSTGFFRAKAKSVKGASQALLERHGGQVPQTMEELVKLPGVGRKTANVVLGNAFKKNVGVVVDTHVARVSGRLALTASTDPVAIEQDLMKLVPQKDWTIFAHRMIDHGRAVCVAKKPKCGICLLNPLCPSAQEPLE